MTEPSTSKIIQIHGNNEMNRFGNDDSNDDVNGIGNGSGSSEDNNDDVKVKTGMNWYRISVDIPEILLLILSILISIFKYFKTGRRMDQLESSLMSYRTEIELSRITSTPIRNDQLQVERNNAVAAAAAATFSSSSSSSTSTRQTIIEMEELP